MKKVEIPSFNNYLQHFLAKGNQLFFKKKVEIPSFDNYLQHFVTKGSQLFDFLSDFWGKFSQPRTNIEFSAKNSKIPYDFFLTSSHGCAKVLNCLQIHLQIEKSLTLSQIDCPKVPNCLQIH